MKRILLISTLLPLLFSCKNISLDKENNVPQFILNTENGSQAKTVYLTHDYVGNPVIAWTIEKAEEGASDFFFAVWNEQKQSFSEKVKIPTIPNVSLHDESMPKISFLKNNQIYAVYEVKLKGIKNKFASSLLYVQSSDLGKTWSNPQSVARDTSIDLSRSYFDLSPLPDGKLGVCWLGNSNKKGRPLMFSKTDDAGQFAKLNEKLVDSFACECCRTAMFSDSNGAVNIVFREILPGNIRDISLAISVNNGNTFNPAKSFSKDYWEVTGCPHNGPSIVADKDYIYSSWFAGGQNSGIFYCSLDRKSGRMNKELISSNARKAQICCLKDGNRLVVFNERIKDSSNIWTVIKAKSFPNEKTFSVSEHKIKAFSPVVIAYKKGAIIAWIQEVGNKNAVVFLNYKL